MVEGTEFEDPEAEGWRGVEGEGAPWAGGDLITPAAEDVNKRAGGEVKQRWRRARARIV